MRQEFVNTAISFLGCKESDGSHKAIIDLYNQIKPLPVGYKLQYTDAWCAGFVSAVAQKCGITDIVFPECGCDRMIALYKKAGRWEE
ncbi:MAG: peptidoglycan-binding protein, partial [Eubacteriales bacterium]